MQQRAHRARLLGVAHRILYLPQDLRLTDHHRVQPAGNPKHVTNGITLWIGVKVGRDVVERDMMKARQPISRMLRLLGSKIEFGTVAGGQDGCLAHRFGMRQIVQGQRQLLRLKRNAFANGERRCVVIQAKGIKLHSGSGQ